jgi:tRNA/tmRNA/rRNA uracil-C5-methylase (TrmA/RlmC/RlmD family)
VRASTRAATAGREPASAPDTAPDTASGWTDRVLDLDVGAVAHGGHCVARVEGRVVFVRHALPGERVRAVVTDDGGGAFCRADAIAVLDAAPGRVEAPCSWARAGGCGGCDWQHASGPLQRELKTAVLREQLQRLGGLADDVLEALAPTVEELPGGLLGWRHRVRLAVDAEGRAGLRAHRSHDVLPIADCPLTPQGSLPAVLAERFRPGGEVAVIVDSDGVRHVCGADGATGRGAEHGPPNPETRAHPTVVQRAAGREWRLAPETFWQVHPALADTLAAVVGEWAQAPAGGLAWDLYGGAGLFAAVLAEQVGPEGTVAVVESAADAVADGRAALADLPQVRWRTGRVEHVLESLPGRPDAVVADPPRRGLGRALVAALCERAPARVVHVACDPAALARDVALFAAHGYRLAALRAFDAFPMTHHLEAVALFVPA